MVRFKSFLLKSLFLLYINIILFNFPLVVSQIPLGSKLSLFESKFWVSSNGDFAFGFFNRPDQQPNLFSVGIHFNSNSIPISNQILVWVVGADVTVGNRSYFELTKNGEMILFDSLKGIVIWTSKTSHLGVSLGVLYDNGNLVLLDSKSNVVWQSFDTPSDVLLPGQNLPLFSNLRAASKNSVSSYYSLYLNKLGNLELRWESSVVYWTSTSTSTSTIKSHLNISVVLTNDGALQIFDQNSNSSIWSVYGEDHNDPIKFRFLRLDVDGNLRIYSWADPVKLWRPVWKAVGNQCDVFATCGLQGICAFNETRSVICKCPFRYINGSGLGPGSQCLAPYGKKCNSGSTIVTYEHTKLYGIYPPNDMTIQGSIQQCKRACLVDPLCTAVTYTNDGNALCLIKKTKYVTGYSDPSISSISFVKMCLDPVAVLPKFPTPSPSRSNYKFSSKICVSCLIGASSGIFTVFILIQTGICFCIYKRRKNTREKTVLEFKNRVSKGIIVFSYAEIMELTDNFKDQIGSSMFKGMLENNNPVVIKRLNAESIEERKFRCLVMKIGNIHHKNLVKLEGYCCESNHRFLVYEFAKNDSVSKYLEECEPSKRLTWRTRMEICISVAKAISYLHSGCREFINHGKLTLQNVIFDENFNVKVTGFGLEKETAEKDVEDFGKMVLELISGSRGNEEICKWVYKEWIEGRRETIVDERMDRPLDLDEVERVLRVMFWCLQCDEKMRPSMAEVVKVLEGTLSVDPPPSPFVRRRQRQGEEETNVEA